MNREANFRKLFHFELILVIIAFSLAPWVVVKLHSQEVPSKKDCAFCSPEVLNRQTLYESEQTLVLSNDRPLLPGHSMVIPKRHVARYEQLTAEEHEEIRLTIHKVKQAFEEVYGTDEYLLVLQNGRKAGQTVSHVHFHMIPRMETNALTKVRLWLSILSNSPLLTSPLNEEQLEEMYGALKAALNQ